jgi:cold shock protein
MPVGKVISFKPERGFGFIAPDEGGPDVFIHVRDLVSGVFPSDLQDGVAVSFELQDSDRGPKAVRVRLFESDASLAVLLRSAVAALDLLTRAARDRGWDV